MQNFDLTKYVEIADVRKWWIILPFLVSLLVGLAYILWVQPIYQAKTLILVQPQKVPEDFVTPIVTSEIEDRLGTITQQVTSRTNLESIIHEYQLYQDKQILLEQKVELCRKRIAIEITRPPKRGGATVAFSISFLGKKPIKVMKITNALASNFVTENLRIRESQALGTSDFLTGELESLKIRLLDKEQQLKEYRETYMGGLPEQLQTNLSILERLQTQLEQLNDNLRDGENRKIIIRKEIAEVAKGETLLSPSSPSHRNEIRDLVSLQYELAFLKSKYTPNHPDVIRITENIAKLANKKSSGSADDTNATASGVETALKRQSRDIELQIEATKRQILEIESQIKYYQSKVEETPKREQELLSLNRDYENVKELYNSLLNRKLEAQIAVSMERKQKGEQFRIIDLAQIPQRPVTPNIPKAILLAIFLGLAVGCGLTYLAEAMDGSYKRADEVISDLELPVLVSLPLKYNNLELKSRKRKTFLAFASLGIGFIISAIAIVFALKGIDTTLAYIMKIIPHLS